MKVKYTTEVIMDQFGANRIAIRKNSKPIEYEQLALIADGLESRLNDLDPLTLFVKEVASGEMSRESMIAEAKGMLREGDE